MEQHLIDLLVWLEPRAIFFALALPPVMRVVGHWLPEELFMICMGVLAARSISPVGAFVLLSAVMLSHFVTDQVVYLIGCWLRPRLGRFKWISRRLKIVTSKLEESPAAVYGLIPARVFPFGRGTWMASFGVVGIPWRRFAAIDILALFAHLAAWSGLGWWLADDLGRLHLSAEFGKTVGMWAGASLGFSVLALIVWRTRLTWQLSAVQVVRRATGSFRQIRS